MDTEKIYLIILFFNMCTAFVFSGINIFIPKFVLKENGEARLFISINICAVLLLFFLMKISWFSFYPEYFFYLINKSLSVFLSFSVFVLPFFIHTCFSSRLKKFFNILFLLTAVSGIILTIITNSNITLIFLLAMMIYLLVFLLAAYLKDIRIRKNALFIVKPFAVLFIISLPFLVYDLYHSIGKYFLNYPYSQMSYSFFPFFYSSLSIVIYIFSRKSSSAIFSRISSLETDKKNNRENFRKMLSIRELEVSDLLFEGSRNKEIADRLNISVPTVKKHISNIFAKACVSSRIELINSDFSAAVPGTIPNYNQNTTNGPFSFFSRICKLNEKYSKEELFMVKRRIISIFSIICAVVTVAAAVFIGCSTIKKNAESVSPADLSAEDINWSFDSLLAKDASYENSDNYWEPSDPKSEGINEYALKTHLELCIRTGADAVVVAHGNKIIFEWYSDRYTPPGSAMSSTKSVTSPLFGIMQDSGLVSVKDHVGDYIPSWQTGRRGDVTLYNLLTMTAGIKRVYQTDGQSVGYVSGKNESLSDLYRIILPEKSGITAMKQHSFYLRYLKLPRA